MKSTITGWGKCSPQSVMTNDDLAKFIDTSDEWIRQRTGIEERRYCHVNNSDMASVAGQHAVACAGLTAEDIDVIILATCTPDSLIPSAAAHVQKKMGAVNASVYDINAACAGFVYAMEQGKAFIESGLYKKALVIGSEHITWLLDWSDRGTAVLFGDGAGAVVLEESTDETEGEIYSFVNGLSSEKLEILEVPNFGSAMDRFKPDEAAKIKWTFEGPEIFKSGVRAMSNASKEVVQKSGLKEEDIDIVIPHQANLRIIEGLEKSLSFPNSKMIKKVQRYGNTSAASIPLALVDAIEEGEIKGGETAIFTAVGAGLSWGACALKLKNDLTPKNTSDAKLPEFDGTAVDTIMKAIKYQIPEKLEQL